MKSGMDLSRRIFGSVSVLSKLFRFMVPVEGIYVAFNVVTINMFFVKFNVWNNRQPYRYS